MKALTLQNSSGSDLGVVEEILEQAHGMTCDIKVAADLPNIAELDVSDYNLIILLGSPRGVYETEHSWIVAEQKFTQRLIAEKKPLWGICFGAQMMAAALGAEVRATGEITRGWRANDAYVNDAWKGPWFRWHGDVFNLPDGAQSLASDGPVQQGIQYGSAVGTQFHPEVDAQIISNWYDHFAKEAAPDEVASLPKDDLLIALKSARKRTELLVADILERCLDGKDQESTQTQNQ
ncbi:type 1 glutamine amidotransferase [uncultured Roseobacter sp.]|uniref:type 1 glutamine amidotransferase n=1 Tax=uncultured Roseobacter sp. TaxID=114847 RepID=UPI002622A797|nr:type 1 glutamine amidotransferase [uncultured Roseobacter sp.]